MGHPHTLARFGPIWPDSLVTRGEERDSFSVSVASIVFDLLCVAGHGPEFEGLSALKGMVEGVVSNAQRLSVRNLWMGGDAGGWRGRQRSPQGVRLINSE